MSGEIPKHKLQDQSADSSIISFESRKELDNDYQSNLDPAV